MKSIISKSLALIAFTATLFSFKTNFGGEGFEISLNGKIVLQQYNKELNEVRTLNLNAAAPSDLLTIRYYHCGKVAKNRIVTIKDGQDKILKELKFKDVSEQRGEMSCKVQDLFGTKKSKDLVLKMYYSSSELPNGRQIAIVSFTGGQDHASINK